MEGLIEVILKKGWCGRKKGQTLKVDPLRAKALIDAGIAELKQAKGEK